ncbi:peptidoglycan-binding domain-containing protein [Thioclava sp. FR2]|uniref:peptidoglycan-binding domain-containing protein n=1 Tax=Thioclava sp. FR2 TaxID=3445780 RepID=UPI003EBFF36D
MKLKAIATAGIAASMIVVPAARVRADAGDAIAGALIGGIIGHAIAKDQQKKKRATPSKSSKSKSSSISAATREQNREVQTALNFFGFPVGTPDGAIGPKSRSAISTYQATLGYPATGQLTEYERTVLVTAYHRGVAGGPVVAQSVASHPMGIKGLLLMQRDEMAGVTAQAPMTVVPVAPAAAAAVVAEPALPSLMPAAPETTVAAPALPSFMGAGVTQVSLASQCNKISLLTNSNGGYVTSATMTDAAFALGEQFCLARTYAVASSEEMVAKVVGFTPQQIAQQCAGFGPAMAEHVSALSLKTKDEVLLGVQGFALKSGMSPVQLAGTAKICLGVGYTTDAMDVAVGSALILVGLGESAYGELLGHHLSQGFGASIRPDLALDWYEMGIDAMSRGGGVFAPGLNDRPQLIRAAAYTVAGRAGELPSVVPAALPVLPLAAQPPVSTGTAGAAAQPLVTTQSAGN